MINSLKSNYIFFSNFLNYHLFKLSSCNLIIVYVKNIFLSIVIYYYFKLFSSNLTHKVILIWKNLLKLIHRFLCFLLRLLCFTFFFHLFICVWVLLVRLLNKIKNIIRLYIYVLEIYNLPKWILSWKFFCAFPFNKINTMIPKSYFFNFFII